MTSPTVNGTQDANALDEQVTDTILKLLLQRLDERLEKLAVEMHEGMKKAEKEIVAHLNAQLIGKFEPALAAVEDKIEPRIKGMENKLQQVRLAVEAAMHEDDGDESDDDDDDEDEHEDREPRTHGDA
jgi:hypothetical protein